MDPTVQERVQRWLNGPYDAEFKSQILRMEKEKPSDLVDAFYRDLSFGTGGMRGIMGVGTNRINIYTVRFATQGLANYLAKRPQELPLRVFIGYDVRIHSRLFADETARVLAGNGIEAFITEDICPTPLASFGCRHEKCSAAVMITASHNPPQYNGYKVFWSDGAQVVPPHDNGIIAEVRLVYSPDQVRLAPITHPLIHWVNGHIDEAYFCELDRLHYYRLHDNPSLKIIYTNLHGTGLRLIPRALQRRGFLPPRLVEQQQSLDGRFPFAVSPNPEEECALLLGTEQLMNEGADVLLATDPDADRLGVVVRDHSQAVRLNGHQIACLCLAHIASLMRARGELPPNAAFIKTIVTTEMARKIAEDFGIQCFDVLTGFKYIAELIREWETSKREQQFLFGAEESHGYLAGTFVRDKDAIGAACLLSEAAQWAKDQNRTLIDRLYDLYRTYGVHRQALFTLAFADSPQGMEKMQTVMTNLRQNPPTQILGRHVVRLDDYLKPHPLSSLPVSDVLSFWLDDQSKLVIRPSGTEPKIKIYAEVCDPPERQVDDSIARCDQRLNDLIKSLHESFSWKNESQAQ
ncbi:MAG: pgcA [Parachlamydiales bacterium]|nr:pgcA [Parachlamydiales bacterium]